MSTNNSITYRKVGDYMIPNLVLPPEESCIKLGKWGMLHKDYLINHKKVEFTILLAKGTLWQHLADIDTQAQQMFDTLVEQMKRKENITEQLKEKNQMQWVSCVQNIQTRLTQMPNSFLTKKVNISAWLHLMVAEWKLLILLK